MADAHEGALGADRSARGVHDAVGGMEVGGVPEEPDPLLGEPARDRADSLAGVDAQVVAQQRAPADAHVAGGGERGAHGLGVEQAHLARLSRGGQLVEHGELRRGAGDRDRAVVDGEEARSGGEVEPAATGDVGEFEQVAGLGGDAGVTEVADGGADGTAVAVDDRDGVPAAQGGGGVCEADDAGTDHEHVGLGEERLSHAGHSARRRRPVSSCGGTCIDKLTSRSPGGGTTRGEFLEFLGIC